MAIQRSGRFERIKPLKSDMNVVPYIDVMLVLLVILYGNCPYDYQWYQGRFTSSK